MDSNTTFLFDVSEIDNVLVDQTIKDVYEALEEKGYNPLVYRLFCLQSHYRNQLVFSYDALDTTKNAYQKLKNKIKTLKNSGNQTDENAFNKYQEKFKDAISNDLNTSLMLTTLYDVLKADINDDTKLKLISSFDTVLSLDLLKTDDVNSTNDLDKELVKHIEEKIEERKQAKQNKNFELADKIRDELLNEGIIIKDTREGVTYEVIK